MSPQFVEYMCTDYYIRVTIPVHPLISSPYIDTYNSIQIHIKKLTFTRAGQGVSRTKVIMQGCTNFQKNVGHIKILGTRKVT